MHSNPRRALFAILALIAWGELVTWRASRDGIPVGRLDSKRFEAGEVVVVLGFASNRRGGLNAVQRWRTRIAARSTDPRAARFVFTGGATRGGESEASLMADYAVTALGIPEENVVLEEQARTTWENISYSIPLIANAPSIKIASNTFHARRARRYLAKQSPQLAARLHRAGDYRPGELTFAKPLLALYEWCRAAVR